MLSWKLMSMSLARALPWQVRREPLSRLALDHLQRKANGGRGFLELHAASHFAELACEEADILGRPFRFEGGR